MKTKGTCTIQGSPIVTASVLRIPLSEQREDLYYYHIRHDDECLGIPVSIEKRVIVNHFGTIAFNNPLQLNQPYELTDEEAEMVMNLM